MSLQFLKPIRFLLFFITFCFVAVPSFRLLQESKRQSVRLRQEISRLRLNNRWHQRIKNDDPETEILKQFINKLQKGMHEDYKQNLKTSGDSIHSEILECGLSKQYLSTWKTPKLGNNTRITVDYGCLRLVDFYTRIENKEEEKKQKEDKQEFNAWFRKATPSERKEKQDKQTFNLVFRRFDTLRENLILQILKSEVGEFKREKDSRIAHTKSILGHFNVDYILDDIPGLRVDSVYIFHKNSQVMAIYPSSPNENYDKPINYKTRPWYKSAFLDSYDHVYYTEFGKNKSALTGIFIDISDENKPNAVRTLWYRFKDAKGEDYIFAIGLFLDKSGTILDKSNAVSGCNSWVCLFWLSTPFEWMMLVSIALLSSLLLSLLYEKLAKRLLPDTDFSINLSGIKFTPIKEYYATLNDQNISFSDSNVTVHLASLQTSAGVKFSLQGTGIESNIERITQRNRQEKQVYSYNFDHQYNLKVGPVRPTHKAVQIWQAERENHLGKSQVIGHMVADWKTNSNVSSRGELSIKSIFWNKKDELYLPSFQRQLRDHLLAGETGELSLVPDTQYQKRQSIPALLSDIDPNQLETVPELKQVIDNSFDLEQGRFFVSQLETVEMLYKLGHVKAIYSIPFIRRIITKGQHDFFRTTAMNTDREEFRFVLEHETHHFKNAVYDHLNQSTQDDWKNESPFQIMVHQRSTTENVILEQEGFSLIYIKNVLRFVLYSLSDDTYSGIGWVSWRKVDLEFFKTLYEYQRSKGNSVKTVKSYIDGH